MRWNASKWPSSFESNFRGKEFLRYPLPHLTWNYSLVFCVFSPIAKWYCYEIRVSQGLPALPANPHFTTLKPRTDVGFWKPEIKLEGHFYLEILTKNSVMAIQIWEKKFTNYSPLWKRALVGFFFPLKNYSHSSELISGHSERYTCYLLLMIKTIEHAYVRKGFQTFSSNLIVSVTSLILAILRGLFPMNFSKTLLKLLRFSLKKKKFIGRWLNSPTWIWIM